jgi:hypothetical protein
MLSIRWQLPLERGRSVLSPVACAALEKCQVTQRHEISSQHRTIARLSTCLKYQCVGAICPARGNDARSWRTIVEIIWPYTKSR